MALVLSELPSEEHSVLADMAKEELITLHQGLGTWIRNNCGLWGDNTALLRACGMEPPFHGFVAEEAWLVILEAVWETLQQRGS